MLQKSATMTKLTMFINAYKLGSVSHLLDAPVFAEFKAHLNEQARASLKQEDDTDGESDGEWEDTSDEASSRGALDEIEKDLNEDSEGSSEETVAVGSSHHAADEEDGDGECEEEGDETGAHHGKTCKHEDGEDFDWDTLDEEDDEESDDDADSDDEEDAADSDDEDDEESKASSSSSSSAAADEEEEETSEEEGSAEEGSSESGSAHHDVADEDDEDDGEALQELADEDAKHHGDAGQVYGSDYRSEQEGSHGSTNESGVKLDGDVKSWPVYKSEILAVLNELKQHILSTMKQAQDDEVLAGVGLADFKLFIDLENRGLEKDLAAQHARREQLAVQQKKNEWKIEHCLAELQTTKDSEFAAKAEHDGTHVQYTENRAAKVSEREIYEYVLGLYEGKINAYNEPHFDENDFRTLDATSGDGETDGETDEDGEYTEVEGEGEGEDEWVEGEGEWVEEEVEEDLFLWFLKFVKNFLMKKKGGNIGANNNW